MSKAGFDKKFTNRLLYTLETEMRHQVQTHTGQLLILKGTAEIRKAILGATGITVNPNSLKTAVLAGQKVALKQQKSYQKNKPDSYNLMKAKIDSGDLGLPEEYILGTNTFLVSSFDYAISLVKKAILDKLVELNYSGGKTTGRGLTKEQKVAASKNLHKGHGVRGSAVSQVQIANSLASLEPSQLQDLRKAFQIGTKGITKKQQNEITRLFAKHTVMVNKTGELRDDYLSIINFQVGTVNMGRDSQEEKALKQAFQKVITDLGDGLIQIPGSSTTLDKMDRIIVDALVPKPASNIKVTRNKNAKAKLKTSTKSTKKVKTTKSAVALSTKTSKRLRESKGVSSTPLQLLGLLNAQLPDRVLKNMGSPALRNRTGRFAGSVRVTDITSTAQGFPSIGYTYQRYPYETFEIGGAQGSAARDPRKLIDKSVREIAAGYAIGRFYTRRV